MTMPYRIIFWMLLVLPVALALGAPAALYLWEHPRMLLWVWLPVVLGWLLAVGLKVFVRRRGQAGVFGAPQVQEQAHWTDRDRRAWHRVTARAERVGHLPGDEYLKAEVYLKCLKEMAVELANHYHPGETDPVNSLTIPEILAAAELAVRDVSRLIDQYVPGSHMLTVGWWRRLGKLPRYVRWAGNAWLALGAVFNPPYAAARWAAGRLGSDPLVRELNADLRAYMFQAFVLSAGKYLIEVYSHRLRIGADRYRALTERPAADVAAESAPHSRVVEPASPGEAEPLAIAVAGQTAAGKSSLIQALVGEARVEVDRLPGHGRVRRHRVQFQSGGPPLALLEIPAYGRDDGNAALAAALAATESAAMLLLAVDATTPARQADRAFLNALEQRSAERLDHVPPPIVAVLTHIDLLPPPLEWSPPYAGWLETSSRRPKEQNIREAVAYTAEAFGDTVARVVPVAADVGRGRIYGIDEWLLPACLELLPQAQARQLVGAIHTEAGKGRWSRLWGQSRRAAALLARFGWRGPTAVIRETRDRK